MSLRHLLRMLLNNEHLIQKISESYPVRRAAQLTTYFFHRGKELGEDSLDKLKESQNANKMQQEGKQVKPLKEESTGFVKELSEVWEKAQKRLEQEKQNLIKGEDSAEKIKELETANKMQQEVKQVKPLKEESTGFVKELSEVWEKAQKRLEQEKQNLIKGEDSLDKIKESETANKMQQEVKQVKPLKEESTGFVKELSEVWEKAQKRLEQEKQNLIKDDDSFEKKKKLDLLNKMLHEMNQAKFSAEKINNFVKKLGEQRERFEEEKQKLLKGEDTFEKMKNSDLRNRMQQEMDFKKDQAKSTVDRTNSFVNRFSSILIEEWKKVEKKLEEEKQKSIEEKKKDR